MADDQSILLNYGTRWAITRPTNRSSRPYRGLEELDYPLHDWSTTVTHCGRICYNRRKINLSQVFAGQRVGVKQVEDKIWLQELTERVPVP